MKLSDLTRSTGEWLRGAGPMSGVVVSSRVRLARNLAGMPFLWRCRPEQQQEIADRLREEILSGGLSAELFHVNVADAGEIDRELLVERHLISRHHAEADHPRGAIVSRDERVSIMINEEDHLRMQVIRSGLELADAVERINEIDDRLEEHLDFAFHSRYGYLTACPTNVGTGLRVSVMLHLPALRISGAIKKVAQAAHDMHLAVRGLHGEGTEASGDFFQVSNQVTLGKTEEQIISEFSDAIVPQIIRYEETARRALLRHERTAIEDRVFRAAAVLRAARRIGAEEALHLLSLLRLGVQLGLVGDVELKTINRLFLLVQPAHLQKLAPRDAGEGDELPPERRAVARADILRGDLSAN